MNQSGRKLAVGVIVLVVAVLAAIAFIAVPAYRDYVAKSRLAAAVTASQVARETLSNYVASTQRYPRSLDEAGIQPRLTDGSTLALDPRAMVLFVRTGQGDLVFTPRVDKQLRMFWVCTNGEGLQESQLPPSCRDMGREHE